MKTQTVKGFRDFLPQDAQKRRFVLQKITSVYQKFGFEPLETPTLEYAETLKGKYGEEEKLIYEFETKGGDKVAMRYDQTVPLARVVAQYGPKGSQVLPTPFKRYQVQSAFRGENTQKGRYREFTQCDADIIGSATPLADAELLAMVYEIYQELGLEVTIQVNDRSQLANVDTSYLAAIDKFDKIGEEGVLKDLESRGLSKEEAAETFKKITTLPLSDNLKEIIKLYTGMGYPENSVQYTPTMVRGLDYYTGLIIEVKNASDIKASTLAAGGRYDKLLGKFIGTDIAATGFSIGLDRTIEALDEKELLQNLPNGTKVLVTIFSPELVKDSLAVAKRLRDNDVNAEIYLDPTVKLDKQLKYADQKGIPFAVIMGPDEAASKTATIKNLQQKTQTQISLEGLAQALK